MAVPPPRATTRESFSFPWAIYRCVTANTKVIKIQPSFPKEAFGKKNPIAFRNICGPGGGTPIHYPYGYVPPNRVVILKLLIQNGVSILEAFSRTGYNISNARKLQYSG